MDITKKQAIRNAVASAEMKGIHPMSASSCLHFRMKYVTITKEGNRIACFHTVLNGEKNGSEISEASCERIPND